MSESQYPCPVPGCTKLYDRWPRLGEHLRRNHVIGHVSLPKSAAPTTSSARRRRAKKKELKHLRRRKFITIGTASVNARPHVAGATIDLRSPSPTPSIDGSGARQLLSPDTPVPCPELEQQHASRKRITPARRELPDARRKGPTWVVNSPSPACQHAHGLDQQVSGQSPDSDADDEIETAAAPAASEQRKSKNRGRRGPEPNSSAIDMLVDDSIDMTDDGLTPNEEEEDDSDPFAELVRNIPGGISSSTKLIPVTRDILGISTERQSQNAFGPFLHHAITPPASSTQSRPRHSSTSAASAIDQLTSPTIPISMSDIGVQTVASGDDDAPCCDAVTKLIRHLATHHSCSTSPYSGMLRSGTPPGGPRALLPPTPRS